VFHLFEGGLRLCELAHRISGFFLLVLEALAGLMQRLVLAVQLRQLLFGLLQLKLKFSELTGVLPGTAGRGGLRGRKIPVCSFQLLAKIVALRCRVTRLASACRARCSARRRVPFWSGQPRRSAPPRHEPVRRASGWR